MSGLTSGLVARDRELSDLDRVLSLARNRRAAAVIVRGEAGTGKSVLLEAAVARAQDFHVIQWRGVKGRGSDVPAHWPQPLAELLARHRAGGPERIARTRSEVAQMQRELTDECAEALRSMIGDSVCPVLLVVDDCQFLPAWLPAALASALTTRLPSLPAALVMAWTDTPHTASVVLWDADVSEHYVAGLPTIALCERLLALHGYVDVAAPVLQWLHGQTRGNPFSLVDGYSRLTPQQRSGWQPLPPVVPMGSDTAIAYGSALSQLPESTRTALGVVAAGRIKTTEYPELFSDLHLDRDALARGCAAGVLVQRGDRIDFAHPLVASAAYHLMPQDLRAAAHRRLAHTLSGHGDIERGAYQAGLASGGPDHQVSAHHQQAARRSMDRGAPGDAARHEEAAATFARAPDGQAQSLASASGLWLMDAEPARAAQCAAQAGDLAMAPTIRARAQYAGARVQFQRSVGDNVLAMLEDTIRICGDDDPILAVLAHLDAAACCALAGRYDDAAVAAGHAVSTSPSLNSQLEALAKAMDGVTRMLAGAPLDLVSDIGNPLSQLMRKPQHFLSSPQVAFTLGLGASLAGPPELADQWASWTLECARLAGDRPLGVVGPLVRAIAGLTTSGDGDGAAMANEAARLGDQTGLTVLASRARAVSGYFGAVRNDPHGALEASALVLGVADDIGPSPTVQAQTNLALLELQAHRGAVVPTWLRGAMEIVRSRQAVGLDFSVLTAPCLGVLCLLNGAQDDAHSLRDSVGSSLLAVPQHRTIRSLLQGICEPDLQLALEHFHDAQSRDGASPMLWAQADLCAAVRLAAASRPAEAQVRLQRSRHSFELLGAHGFAALADRALAGGATPDHTDRPADPPVAVTVTHTSGIEGATKWTDAQHEWEISLLGGFTVRRKGSEAAIPQSLAAQALKIVTLHKKIHVDELVEMLWPEAGPGVGSRRLRNVLWRIRGACGDLIQREGNLICLAKDAATDIDRFDDLASQALSCDGDAKEVARLAAEADAVYRGELLPGDRYADWTAAYREALLRRHASMLELLVTSALVEKRLDQALTILERLIETDPFEEHYYLQVAEIHVEAGQFHRAHNALERASRMLVDLGVPPSQTLLRAKQSLPRDESS